MKNRTKRIALNGMMIALALILGFVESQVPTFFAVPGIKLGLTNLVVFYALYVLDAKEAFFINIVRIIIAGCLFGTGVSLIYSLSGGVLSFLIMYLFKRLGIFKGVTVSIAGGISHNIGQILAAVFMVRTVAVAGYFVVLWFAGIVSGAVIGSIGGMLISRIDFEANYEIMD